MSEIEDLKNHITALSSKLNHLVDMVKNTFVINDKMNELLGLMHEIGLTNQNKNNDIFGCILPDIVRRLTLTEELLHKKEKNCGEGDHVDFWIGKGKKKDKIHMYIRSTDVVFYTKEKSFTIEL